MTLFDRFASFDDSLAAAGVPALGPWWRAGLRRWFDAYERGEALELWACCGRGSSKSTVAYRLALFFTLFGAFDVPPGETHYAIVLSRLKGEAAKGVAIIDRWLTLLGVPHRLAGDVVELADSPRGIRVVAASVQAASGWRAFFVACDEYSKWAMGDGADALDAVEVRTSAMAMTATHERAPLFVAGSAWGAFGDFYDAIVAGDEGARVVLGPEPTWIATDGRITEAMCRAKERDPRRFAREYECEFQGSASAALDLDELRACVRSTAGFVAKGAPVIVQDPSGGSGNAMAWAAFQWGSLDGVRALRVFGMSAVTDAKRKGLSSDAMADRVARAAGAVGASIVHSDQHAAWTWKAAFEQRSLRFVDHPWDNPTKGRAIVRLRELLSCRLLALEPGPEANALLDEASRYEERLTPSGATKYEASKGNDDRVAVLLLAARLDLENQLRGSPLRALRDAPPTRGSSGAMGGNATSLHFGTPIPSAREFLSGGGYLPAPTSFPTRRAAAPQAHPASGLPRQEVPQPALAEQFAHDISGLQGRR